VSYIYEDILSDVSPSIKVLQSQSGKVLRLGVEASYVNNRWKSVPWYHQSFPMVYRKDHCAQVGYSVDKMNRLTVDEFLDMAKKLDKIGHPVGIPISSCPDSNACLTPFLWAFGGSMFEGKNKIVINSKETRDALQYIAELSRYMPKEVKGWDNAGNNLFMLSGVGAVSANPPSIYAAAHKDKMVFASEIYHAPFPAGKAGSYRFSGVWSLGVPEFSKNKKEALDLIKFIMKRDNFIALVEASNGYDQPLYEGLQGHTIWSANPALSAYEPASENLFPIGWPGPNAFPTKASVRAQLLYILPTMFSKVVVGESTPDQAIAWAESELKRLVEEEPE
jgi:multiple sugar transport system substrate-binding protein